MSNLRALKTDDQYAQQQSLRHRHHHPVEEGTPQDDVDSCFGGVTSAFLASQYAVVRADVTLVFFTSSSPFTGVSGIWALALKTQLQEDGSFTSELLVQSLVWWQRDMYQSQSMSRKEP